MLEEDNIEEKSKENSEKATIKKSVLVINTVLMMFLLFSMGTLGIKTLGKNPEGDGGSSVLGEIKDYTYTNKKDITHIGDPHVFFDEKTQKYYMTATSAGDGFELYSTEDFKTWKPHGTIFSIYAKGNWATREMWGPEIIFKDDKYYLFYSARWDENDSPRIGVAVSDYVDGPYEEHIGKPLFDFGYAVIDNHYFKDDDGQEYLYYSRDCSENVVNGIHESHLYVVKLAPDLKSVQGSEGTFCTRPEKEWEFQSGNAWRWNEGPWMMKQNDKYYLLYSGNYYADKSYSIGYAVADNPMGPFEKYEDNILIQAEYNEISGPGNNSVFLSPDGKELWTAYHLHTDPTVGGGDRYLNIDRMGVREDGTLYINAPTVGPQPLPSGTYNYLTLLSNEAKVVASSTKNGYKESAMNDGEIGITSRNEQYEWVADGAPEEASITLQWDQKQEVHTIYIYGSAVLERKCRTVDLELSNGEVIKNIAMPIQNGEPAIITLNGAELDWIKVKVNEVGFGQKEAGLSEIMVFGKQK